ncbi:hypothetical protein PUN28_016512 [Cardiocondyla obscurior]|uniref:Uncharacterized protein n=1 Tax=Cardiocondyla obscurior TaxID=286306 RepID=A0AAW2ESB0_9HYME
MSSHLHRRRIAPADIHNLLRRQYWIPFIAILTFASGVTRNNVGDLCNHALRHPGQCITNLADNLNRVHIQVSRTSTADNPRLDCSDYLGNHRCTSKKICDSV